MTFALLIAFPTFGNIFFMQQQTLAACLTCVAEGGDGWLVQRQGCAAPSKPVPAREFVSS